MEEMKNIVSLLIIFRKVLLKYYRKAFSCIQLQAQESVKENFKHVMQKLDRPKGKIARAFDWIVRTGRVNVQQRGLIRWKINVFPIIKPKNLLYWNKDRVFIIKSLKTFSENFYFRLKTQAFAKFKIFSIKFNQLLSKQKRIKNKILSLDVFFKSHLKSRLILWKKTTTWLKKLKEKFRLISKLFLKNFQKSFDNFRAEEYYYESYYIETVVKTDKVTKNFKILIKPVCHVESYDIHSSDPAYRAVSRNLSHFIKRRKLECFKIWKKFIISNKISVQSISSFLQGTKKSNYNLTSSQLSKLKRLLIQFSLIQEKISQMPEKCLTTWSGKAQTSLLKTLKFKIIVNKLQKGRQNLQISYNKWKFYQKSFHLFTDTE